VKAYRFFLKISSSRGIEHVAAVCPVSPQFQELEITTLTLLCRWPCIFIQCQPSKACCVLRRGTPIRLATLVEYSTARNTDVGRIMRTFCESLLAFARNCNNRLRLSSIKLRLQLDLIIHLVDRWIELNNILYDHFENKQSTIFN